DVFDVIKTPVPVQQSPLSRQSSIKSGIRKRRRYRIARQIDLDPINKLDRSFEHIRIVVIESKNKTALNADAVIVELLDDFSILRRRMKTFMGFVERVLADRFEANEQTFAAALGRQLEKFPIFRNPRGR